MLIGCVGTLCGVTEHDLDKAVDKGVLAGTGEASPLTPPSILTKK